MIKSGPRQAASLPMRASKASITANDMCFGDGGGMGGFNSPMASGAPISTMGFGGPAFNTTFMGILPEYNENLLLQYYRDCYYYDSVGGATVDIISSFPFSEWTLAGVENDKIVKYNESLARLNMRSLLQEVSNSYLVDSAFIGSLVYDPVGKIFQDILVHDFANASITPQPFYSIDPVISVNTTNQLNQFLNAGSPFVGEVMKNYPKDLIRTFMGGSTILDPLTTVYLPRKGMQDRTSASYLKRLLPVYMLEKILYRGTLTEATKRLRSTSHIKLGDDNWEPNNAEMASILADFQRSELDPLGAWLVTRQGVDVQEIRCLSGSSLINTDKGLIPIQDIVKHNPDTMIPGSRVRVNISAINHLGKFAPVKYWWYQGFKPTVDVKLNDGTVLNCTENHKFLTVGDHLLPVLVKTSKMEENFTWVLRPSSVEKIVEDEDLDLDWPDIESRPSNSGIKLPKRMTPKLAYCLALLISEGTISERGLGIVNTDVRILKRFQRFMTDLFGLQFKLKFSGKPIDEWVFNMRGSGKHAHFTKPIGTSGIGSKHIVDILRQLGVKPSAELRTHRSPSYSKSVPDCILRASERCQLAFLSGYIDGDGTPHHYHLRWRSTSDQICTSIHSLIVGMGYEAQLGVPEGEEEDKYLSCGCVQVVGTSAVTLRDHMNSIRLDDCEDSVYRTGNSEGVPGCLVTKALLDRQISYRNFKLDGVRGSLFRGDDGEEVFVPGGWKYVFRHYWNSRPSKGQKFNAGTFFSYDSYQQGKYNKHLSIIKKVSPLIYNNLIKLLRARHVFLQVKSITESKPQHVYDLTMDESVPPLFCVNGVISKNSAGEMWKWTDNIDTLTPFKLRALGISEAFLSGDASYATAETAVSVFMENMDAYRKFITYKMFTNKIFPLVAVLNGFYKDPKKAKEVKTSGDLMFNLNNQNNLEIPEVHWHKSLEAKSAESDFDMLEKLSEKGFSVPLKMWAAAAGVDMNMMMRDLEEDKKIKEAISRVTGVHPDDQGRNGGGEEAVGGEEDGNDMRFSAMNPSNMGTRPSSAPGISRRRPLLAREFDTTTAKLSKSGKVVHAVNEHRSNKHMNDLIMKASKALQDPNHRESLRKKVAEKLGNKGSNLGII